MGKMTVCSVYKNIGKGSRHFEGNASELALVNGKCRVEWVDLGEGKDGYYDHSDSDNVELLRFDVYFDGESIPDGSYCTLMPVNTPEDILKKGLERIMDTIHDKCVVGDCWKISGKVFEELSWIDPKWFR